MIDNELTSSLARALISASGDNRDKLLVRLSSLLQQGKSGEEKEAVRASLLASYKKYLERHNFKVGDLITWKVGLKDRKFPDIGEPAVVIEVLQEPIVEASKDAGEPYFRAKYDLVCGVIVDNNLLMYHLESSRFEPYEPVNG